MHTRAQGMGIEFNLSREEERALSAVIAQAVRRERRALVVDDNLLARRMVSDRLKRYAFEVAEASDGPTALRALGGVPETVDVVIADLAMPGMSGEELVAAIRSASDGAGPRSSSRQDGSTRG